MKTKVQIDDRYGVKFPIKRKISKIVSLLFENETIKEKSAICGFEVNALAFDIVFCDDNEIQKINSEYRKIDKPTDVITFALFADDENKFVYDKIVELGEIIISVEMAKNQAKIDLQNEILTLICHGILHLLGFDHKTDKDYNFVVGIQEFVISNL